MTAFCIPLRWVRRAVCLILWQSLYYKSRWSANMFLDGSFGVVNGRLMYLLLGNDNYNGHIFGCVLSFWCFFCCFSSFRYICRTKRTKSHYTSDKKFVVYRGPCGRRIRNNKEMGDYLFMTDSKLTIDFFSFEQSLHLFEPFQAINVSILMQLMYMCVFNVVIQ